ncbi:TPA: class I SAM-dependent methyltransferase [Methanosarcinaceae archaeon]|nr:class I SAM-dependent methyltransferase [Methanosarcinaceae archaeon]
MLVNKKIRSKIRDVLKFNETDINLSSYEQEEQALPGMHKYLQSGWYKYMIGRYLFSLKFVRNKLVLDTACGLGWGSYLISDYPKYLMSVDIDDKSLDFAKKQWKSNEIEFKKMSILELSKLNTNFDVVLSYEVIEHLEYYDGLTYVNEVSKVLNSKGIFILSPYFPDNEKDARMAEKKNKFHPHIYTKNEMNSILQKNDFSRIKYYGDLIIRAEKL